MADITAALVKELRNKTNAGMMDCKKALIETNGNMEEAVLYLRERGIAKAASKADRAANQGIIATRISTCGCDGILFEINCETDFVSKNDNFKNFVNTVGDALIASDAKDLNAALAISINGGSMSDFIKAKVIEIGENMMLRKFERFSLTDGACGAITSYIHMGGKVGVLLEVTTGKADTSKTDDFQTLIRDLTLHIAAAAPLSISGADLDPAFVAEEQEIAKKQLIDEGKPEKLLEKILPGKLKALYKQSCFLDQEFVKDPSISIEQLIGNVGKQLDDQISVKAFTRFQLGM
ncbi:MAG: translation elongation factor Ts [Akkermansia sp.]